MNIRGGLGGISPPGIRKCLKMSVFDLNLVHYNMILKNSGQAMAYMCATKRNFINCTQGHFLKEKFQLIDMSRHVIDIPNWVNLPPKQNF